MAIGSFGSNENRNIHPNIPNRLSVDCNGARIRSTLRNIRERAGMLSPKRWVDIVCCSILAVVGTLIACSWASFMDGLFYGVLFPVICVGGKIVTGIIVIAIIFAIISFRFRRRRFW